MAKRRKRNRSVEPEESSGGSKTGMIALLLIVGVAAVMAWATIGLGKPKTTVENSVQLPSYAFVSARSEQSYRASIDPLILEGEAFSKIPCYCGCVNVGHGSLKDCFLGDHGSYCDVCQFEALETYDLVKQGVSIAEIRSTIDGRWGNGRYAEGTDTPPVV